MQHILQLARLGRRIEWVPDSGKVVIPLFSFSEGEDLAMVGLKLHFDPFSTLID
jgi:hypothetical protein